MNENLSVMKVGCYVCNKEGEMWTCTCEIPFFKEIMLMAFSCEHCGYRNADVKITGEISEKGKKITLKVEKNDDL